ncbi:unnamed protein product [Didymodactylos carnosus]|uniref:CUB domain-containing protein n=1 Tax=Didymodactylos carnosus TaxID=1234261 RepID=A0A814HQQ1_9BILA|nr:unnamed protein product [Didymodactylos carnosus]CAF1012641.1 unnamed protein product [Didymodactylos carnosus]CAF3521749.1 unnamed protein product [Didymodactylos carnosus]CAF3784005.1 unnamed protein product [Didymodactylos carnosus]
MYTLIWFHFIVLTKTYEKFWCTTQEGPQQLTCPDDDALLTDVIVKKVYRRTKRCEPDVHTEYLIHCQNNINATQCEGNHSCTIDISSTDYVLCKDGERQAPTYFFVKYTCMQIYTLCQHKETVRNTLYGFIVSPEAEHSMHIELAPLQLQLHDSIKCHTEYLEIFGYGGNSNDSLTNNNNHYQNGKNGAIWKWYHTWCGDERSSNHPLSSARYIIPSNSVYMSLQTTLSSKSRHFKIRYKVVPSTSRNYDHVILPSSTTPILSLASITTTVFGIVEEFANKNQTITKKSHKKEIIIGVIAGIGTLVVAIAIGIVLLIFFKRRQSSVKTSSSSASKNVTASKKPLSAATTKNNTNQKHVPTPSDKTPMLDSSPTSGAQAQKRKLVPERTVQISDLNSSRFKPTTTPVGGNAATTTTSSHQLKEVSSTGSEAAGTAIMTSAVPPSLKPIVSVDSGVYGAELTDQQATVDKIKEAKIYGIDLPDKVETLTKTISINPSLEQPSSPIHITQEVNDNSDDLVQIVVNPLSELENLTNTAVTISDKIDTEITPLLPVENPETLDNTRASSPLTPPTLLSNDISHTPPPSVFDVNSRRQSQLEPLSSPHNKGDTTVTSAYPTLIDATASENEGDNRQIVEKHVENSVIYNQPKKTTFNPLHVILKKDANKYYTTEYI